MWNPAEGVLTPTDEAFRQHLLDGYEVFTSQILDAGATRVIWVIPPKADLPAVGHLAPMLDDDRIEAYRRVLRALPLSFPGQVVTIDLAGWLGGRTGPARALRRAALDARRRGARHRGVPRTGDRSPRCCRATSGRRDGGQANRTDRRALRSAAPRPLVPHRLGGGTVRSTRRVREQPALRCRAGTAASGVARRTAPRRSGRRGRPRPRHRLGRRGAVGTMDRACSGRTGRTRSGRTSCSAARATAPSSRGVSVPNRSSSTRSGSTCRSAPR